MNNSQILELIKENKENSVAYQQVYGVNDMKPKDEIAGHIEYESFAVEDHISPSDEFITELFKECAHELGFQYEQR